MSDSTRPDQLALIPTRKITEDDKHHVRRIVASHSRDAADCRELLQMLGLIEPDFRWETFDPHRGAEGRRKILTGGCQ